MTVVNTMQQLEQQTEQHF